MPTSVPASVVLVVPGFAAELVGRGKLPVSLVELFKRASVVNSTRRGAAHQRWQVELMTALGIQDPERFSSATTSLFAEESLYQGACFHLEYVRMEMSSDGLSLVPAKQLRCSPEIEAVLQRFLKSADAELLYIGKRRFVKMKRELSVRTVTVEYALGRPLRDVLPQGTDAGEVRRLMTELQMLLHSGAVSGLNANAAWLWGNGPMATASDRALPAIWTNEEFSRGLHRLHGTTSRCESLPKTFGDVRPLDPQTVIVLRDLGAEEVDEHWITPALSALSARGIGSLKLCIDGVCLEAAPSLLRRLLPRRGVSMAQLTEMLNDSVH